MKNSVKLKFDKIIKKYGENLDFFDWQDISENEKLSEDFIEEFKDKLNWDLISLKQSLSKKFIIKYKDSVNWNILINKSENKEKFIMNYAEFINPSVIFKYSNNFIESEKLYNKIRSIQNSLYTPK